MKELISDLFPEIIDMLPGELVDTFLGAITKILEILFELEDGFLDFNKPISDILHEWLDIELGVDEDCLHLSVRYLVFQVVIHKSSKMRGTSQMPIDDDKSLATSIDDDAGI